MTAPTFLHLDLPWRSKCTIRLYKYPMGHILLMHYCRQDGHKVDLSITLMVFGGLLNINVYILCLYVLIGKPSMFCWKVLSADANSPILSQLAAFQTVVCIYNNNITWFKH